MSFRASTISKTEEQRESVVNELTIRITEAFKVYDHNGDNTVNPRDVGTIIRSLGCCPTEAEVKDIIVQSEDPEKAGVVPLRYFLPVVAQIISDFKMKPSSAEDLLEAFQTLDKEGKGFLEPQMMAKAMMEEGESFTQEEIEEMMTLAVDPVTGHIPYEYYINQLVVNVEPNIFSLVPKKSVVKKRKLGEGLV
ncbi:dynein regulatory complex protein 8-like [Homalodisca vitripennis]|uniref:dynein regulatory complex protein 8-like n=1 Tax=Homalodisca vitripennis TaxID=197043 RepID=UPI001EEBBF09|nr:dynein regulatory complex protein 8-like [Homalodisca vitripennis]